MTAARGVARQHPGDPARSQNAAVLKTLLNEFHVVIQQVGMEPGVPAAERRMMIGPLCGDSGDKSANVVSRIKSLLVAVFFRWYPNADAYLR